MFAKYEGQLRQLYERYSYAPTEAGCPYRRLSLASLTKMVQVSGLLNRAFTHTDIVLAFRGAMIDAGSTDELVNDDESVDTATTRTTATKATAQVSGWGAYCQASVGFLLLPVAPSVSCSSVDALHTHCDINFRRLPLSPAISERLQPV